MNTFRLFVRVGIIIALMVGVSCLEDADANSTNLDEKKAEKYDDPFEERITPEFPVSLGSIAVIPCSKPSPVLDGLNSYLMWFNSSGDVIYKFPDDNNTYNRSKVQNYEFRRKCTGECPDKTALLIEKVQKDDAGLYNCRVHYQGFPSDDHYVEVKVVGSPGQPRIYDRSAKEINNTIGPLTIGSSLDLFCEIPRGHSDSYVWWERNGVMMDLRTSLRGIVIHKLSLVDITRAEKGVEYTCLSKNSNSVPLSTSVVINMTLPPISVDINLGNDVYFEADQPRVVDCIIHGCTPPPVVSWSLNGMLLPPDIHAITNKGPEYTVSSLVLTPALKNDNHTLACHAHNYLLPGKSFDNKVEIRVGYRPKCLSDETTLIGVVDGETEIATCFVDSFPQPNHFIWHFDILDDPFSTSPSKFINNVYMSSFKWTHPYKPRSSTAHLMFCYASNLFGKQREPCRFAVLKGGPPSQPRCEVLAQYPRNLYLNCTQCFDGGRPATYHLEFYNLKHDMVAKYTAKTGYFELEDFKEDNVTAMIYSASVRGRSKSTYVDIPHFPIEEVINDTIADNITITTTAVKELTPVPEYHGMWWKVLIGLVMASFSFLIVVQCTKVIINKICHKGPLPRNHGVFYREPEYPMSARESLTLNHGQTVNMIREQPRNGSCRAMIRCTDSTNGEQETFYV